MRRRALLCFLFAALAIGPLGCKSKAQKQAEAAAADVARLEKVIADRHLDSLARAVPQGASALGGKLNPASDFRAEAASLGTSFIEARNKSDDLRSAKRSYYVLIDAGGEVVWVDDNAWAVVGRKLAVGFPSIKDVLDGKAPFARGTGRYGGAGEDALTFADAAPIKEPGGKVVGALVAAWEAHEAAEDLQRQLATELAMKVVEPKKRVKEKDKLKLAMDTPEMWVAIFRGPVIYLPDDGPQPLEDALKKLELAKKTAGGPWSGTFDVMNGSWGGAARRIDALGPEVGVAVLRHEPERRYAYVTSELTGVGSKRSRPPRKPSSMTNA
jgi:hypothetical protein